ncbi:hypothetical protein B0H19DRAFT_1071601 [Mycena capillaripes]|nr:hypothetical protein B0H19DRAFT_1071601 [Mycena capillaripes]
MLPKNVVSVIPRDVLLGGGVGKVEEVEEVSEEVMEAASMFLRSCMKKGKGKGKGSGRRARREKEREEKEEGREGRRGRKSLPLTPKKSPSRTEGNALSQGPLDAPPPPQRRGDQPPLYGVLLSGEEVDVHGGGEEGGGLWVGARRGCFRDVGLWSARRPRLLKTAGEWRCCFGSGWRGRGPRQGWWEWAFALGCGVLPLRCCLAHWADREFGVKRSYLGAFLFPVLLPLPSLSSFHNLTLKHAPHLCMRYCPICHNKLTAELKALNASACCPHTSTMHIIGGRHWSTKLSTTPLLSTSSRSPTAAEGIVDKPLTVERVAWFTRAGNRNGNSGNGNSDGRNSDGDRNNIILQRQNVCAWGRDDCPFCSTAKRGKITWCGSGRDGEDSAYGVNIVVVLVPASSRSCCRHCGALARRHTSPVVGCTGGKASRLGVSESAGPRGATIGAAGVMRGVGVLTGVSKFDRSRKTKKDGGKAMRVNLTLRNAALASGHLGQSKIQAASHTDENSYTCFCRKIDSTYVHVRHVFRSVVHFVASAYHYGISSHLSLSDESWIFRASIALASGTTLHTYISKKAAKHQVQLARASLEVLQKAFFSIATGSTGYANIMVEWICPLHFNETHRQRFNFKKAALTLVASFRPYMLPS